MCFSLTTCARLTPQDHRFADQPFVGAEARPFRSMAVKLAHRSWTGQRTSAHGSWHASPGARELPPGCSTARTPAGDPCPRPHRGRSVRS